MSQVLEELALRLTTEGDAQMKGALAGVSHGVDHLVSDLKRLVTGYLTFEFWKHTIESTVAMGVELTKLSEKTGATVDDLSRLEYAAQQSLVSTDELTTGLRFLTKSMQGVDLETGKAAEALKVMGVETKDTAGKQRPLLDVLLEVADKFASYADGPAKGALALNIFGRAGTSMIPLLNKGSEAIRDLMQQSDALGNTMSAQAAHELVEYEHALGRLKGMWSGVAREITLHVVPALTEWMDSVTESESSMDDLSTLGKLALSVFSGLGFVLGEVGVLVVGAVGEVVDAVTLLARLPGVAWEMLKGNSDEALTMFRGNLSELKDNAKKTWDLMGAEADKLAERMDAIWNPKEKPKSVAHHAAETKPDAPLLPNTNDDKAFTDSKEKYTDFAAFLRAQYEYQMTLAEDDYEKKHALAERWLGLMFLIYGANTREYQNQLTEIARLDKDEADRKKEKAKTDREAFMRRLQENSDAANDALRELNDRARVFTDAVSGILQDTFTAAFAKGGGLGAGLKAFTKSLLAGLGDAMVQFGTNALKMAVFMDTIMKAIQSFIPGGAIVAALAMIAVGSALRGSAGGLFHGAGGGAASPSGYNIPVVPLSTRFVFGENSATTAAGMTPRQAVNVTLIGPNDPVAGRQLQQLLDNNARRGSAMRG